MIGIARMWVWKLTKEEPVWKLLEPLDGSKGRYFCTSWCTYRYLYYSQYFHPDLLGTCLICLEFRMPSLFLLCHNFRMQLHSIRLREMIHHERWGSVVMQPSPDTSPTALEGWDAVLMDKDPALMLMWELFTDRKIYRHFIHVCIHTCILHAYISKAKDWSLESFRSYHITLAHQRCTLQLGSIPNRWDEASLASRAREAPGASPNTVGASPKKTGGSCLKVATLRER